MNDLTTCFGMRLRVDDLLKFSTTKYERDRLSAVNERGVVSNCEELMSRAPCCSISSLPGQGVSKTPCQL